MPMVFVHETGSVEGGEAIRKVVELARVPIAGETIRMGTADAPIVLSVERVVFRHNAAPVVDVKRQDGSAVGYFL